MTNRTVGYVRVSSIDQNPNLQIDALKFCDELFIDKVSGSSLQRPEFLKAMKSLKSGDTLVVWKLDRLSRSMRDLVNTMEHLNLHGIQLKCIKESIDTREITGKLLFGILASIVEFERAVTKERCHAGIKAARARGVSMGRPRKIGNEAFAKAVEAYEAKGLTLSEIARAMGVGRTTLYRFMKERSEVFA